MHPFFLAEFSFITHVVVRMCTGKFSTTHSSRSHRHALSHFVVRESPFFFSLSLSSCSPDGKFVAISLLDSTIRVFYLDSLKFYLSLYGHKLPALSIDISSDSTLLISGGADKDIRIWGLDFGK